MSSEVSPSTESSGHCSQGVKGKCVVQTLVKRTPPRRRRETMGSGRTPPALASQLASPLTTARFDRAATAVASAQGDDIKVRVELVAEYAEADDGDEKGSHRLLEPACFPPALRVAN